MTLVTDTRSATLVTDTRSATLVTDTRSATLLGSRALWLAVFAISWLMQSLTNGYALFHMSVLIVLWLIWFVRDPARMVRIGAAWAAAAAPLVPVLLKYREVHDRLHLARDINEIRGFGADLAAFVAAPPELAIWGGRLLPSEFETALFPGLTTIVLFAAASVLAFRHRRREGISTGRARKLFGALGLVCAAIAGSVPLFGPWSLGSLLTVSSVHKPFSLAVLAGAIWLAMGEWWRRRWRERSVPIFYAAAAVVMYVLCLGPEPLLLGRPILYEPPYAWLMRLPGFDVLRVPARFAMPALICQAMLVALVFVKWIPMAHRRIAAIAIGCGLLADGWTRMPLVPAASFAAPPAASAWSQAGVKGIIELPPGEPIVDFPALYRGMSHRQPVANGYSGFVPPHYLALVYAIGHGHPAALQELAAGGPLGVAVDRSLHWHTEMEAAVSSLSTSRALAADERWATFVVDAPPPAALELGPRLPLAAVRSNRREQDVGRLSDGDVETAWGPEAPQDGEEELIVELQSVDRVAVIVLDMGAFAFGFPRELAIDISPDGREWQTAWRGDTSVATVRAAVRDPVIVPVAFALPAAISGKFVRLRQLGADPIVPWWIAELEIHAAGPD